MWTTFRRKYRSFRKRCCCTSALRSLFVAAIKRTSTAMVLVPPTLSKLISSSTRRSFTCRETGISPISSRKRVPPSASSKRPFFMAVAPVKAPFSWPNSSLSRRVSVRAAQLIATNGLLRRGLLKWIAFAISSLPVPLSPVVNIVVLVCATFRMISNRACIGLLLPIMLSKR